MTVRASGMGLIAGIGAGPQRWSVGQGETLCDGVPGDDR